MNIEKNSAAVAAAVTAFADENGYTVDAERTPDSLHLDKGSHGFEFIAENGFAYLHGEGDLNGYGTTVMDTDELVEAVARLLEKLPA